MAHLVEPESGVVVEQRYRVRHRLGSGAGGTVYAAQALGPALRSHGRRDVAIKVLGRWNASDEEAATRFVHEAYLGSRLDHPCLVRVLDFGHLRDGRPYTVMERCLGLPLSDLLSAAGLLTPALALPLVRAAAAGLEYLHHAGLVHRDIKAANLFVVGAGRLRILDLGAAGVFDADAAAALGIEDLGGGAGYGTPTTLAPEQALGLPCDATTDVYALACVSYRMLTGADPHRAATAKAVVRAHLFQEVRPATEVNPALPAAVDAVLARGLEKDRNHRTRSAARFSAELAVALRV